MKLNKLILFSVRLFIAVLSSWVSCSQYKQACVCVWCVCVFCCFCYVRFSHSASLQQLVPQQSSQAETHWRGNIKQKPFEWNIKCSCNYIPILSRVHWKGLFLEDHGRGNLRCLASLMHHLWESTQSNGMRYFIILGHLYWQYNNGIQISLWTYSINNKSSHSMHLPSPPPPPQITWQLSRNPPAGRRASPHACLSQQCPTRKPCVVRSGLREWENTTHSG